MKQTTVKLNYLQVSPRKVRLLVDLVRGMRAVDAVNELEFSSKAAAEPLVKLIRSAIANAKHNHELKEESLVITSAYVNGGPIAYRYTPRAFGRATPIRHWTAHVTLVLEGEEGAARAKKDEAETVVQDASEGSGTAEETKGKKAERTVKTAKSTPKKTGTKKNVSRKVTLQRRSGG